MGGSSEPLSFVHGAVVGARGCGGHPVGSEEAVVAPGKGRLAPQELREVGYQGGAGGGGSGEVGTWVVPGWVSKLCKGGRNTG